MNSYCGKDCEACAQRKKINCPGCQGVSKEAWPGRCSLAACAKAKGNRSCAQCIYATGCQKLKRKDREPMATLQRLQAEATGKRRKKEQAAFLGKWLWVLFWMFLPSLVAGLLTDPTLTAQFPQLSLPGTVFSLAYTVAYGVILLLLSKECSKYKLAGAFVIAGGLVGLLPSLISAAQYNSSLSLLLTLPGLALSIAAQFMEFYGHSQVIEPYDNTLSLRWKQLWTWNLILTLVNFASGLLLSVSWFFGLVLGLLASVASLALLVLKLVYLYRTAQLFREKAGLRPQDRP